MDSPAYDIIVVGAGVVGTFHAYFAALSGARVLLVERDPAPNEATVRNFGMVATGTIATPGKWDKYARATSEIYRHLEAEIDEDLTLRKQGCLYLVETEPEDRVIREFADLSPRIGKQAYYLDREDVLKEYPFAQPDYVRSGLLLPDDMSVDPRKFIHILQRHFTKTGLFDYRPHTCIVKVTSTTSHCALTDAQGNNWQAEKVIICCGTEYRILFPDLFRESPLKISKLQMLLSRPQPHLRLPHSILSGLTLRRYPAFSLCPSYQQLMDSPFEEVFRKWGIHLLFKQADDGSVIIGDSHEYFPLSENGSVSFDVLEEINEAILDYGKRMIRLDDWRIQKTWNGYYLSHPTKEIFKEQIDARIHVATGISGKGMSTAAGFSQRNVELIVDG
jgi:D-hydroxyproline dehydrogenase subunit beta